jgi:hypothetical protein
MSQQKKIFLLNLTREFHETSSGEGHHVITAANSGRAPAVQDHCPFDSTHGSFAAGNFFKRGAG